MRGRTVLFVVLAVVMALGGVYIGWSTNTPKAIGEQATATPTDASVGSTQRRGSGPARSPTGSPKGSAEQGSPSKGSAPNSSAPKNDANQAGTTTPSGNTSANPPASMPQHRAGPVRIGPVTTTSGLSGVTEIADDRRVLSTTFSDFEVTMDATSAEPVVTKTFSMTLPLTDGAKEETLRVHASGIAVLQEGVKARIALKGGGRQLLKGFAAGSEEYVEMLELRARPGVTYQLSFAIEINRGAGTARHGYLNMLSIEIEIS